MSDSSSVKHISECFIKPKYVVEESKNPYHLTPSGLSLISVQYMQNGLLFSKSQLNSVQNILKSLKESLSLTLVHFYPLAGQMVTQVNEDRHECLIFVDCNKGPGARFIHATSQMTISNILSPTYVPVVVQSFFDLNRAVNYDGHTQPLLSVQVTELLDGIFIGVSINHALGDGTTFLNFWHSWSQIHRPPINGKHTLVSHPPIHNGWFPGGSIHGVPLPFTHPNEFIVRCEAPQLKERIFHFSSESMQRLKEKVNIESNTHKISSLQALIALIWRSIVRASHLSQDQITNCGLAVNNRDRLHPPLPQSYFRTSIDTIKATTIVEELLEHNLGWAALLVHQCVASHTDKAVRESLNTWLKTPVFYNLSTISNSFSLLMTSSPHLDFYGVEFGFGKPLATRSGPTNKFAGNLAVYPGYDGKGCLDLEVYLPPNSMTALESDNEFMDTIFLPDMRAKELPCTPKQFSKI